MQRLGRPDLVYIQTGKKGKYALDSVSVFAGVGLFVRPEILGLARSNNSYLLRCRCRVHTAFLKR